MPPTFGWDNLEDIAIGLTDKFPHTNPLTVRFTDMHKWITELPGFSGDPAASTKPNSKPFRWPGTRNFRTASLRLQRQRDSGEMSRARPALPYELLDSSLF